MSETNRREMLCAGAVLGAGIAAGAALKSSTIEACPGKEKGYSGEKEYTFGHTNLFMEGYYRGTREILRPLSGELDHIGELTSRAAQVIKNGGAIWHSMNVGHMPQTELADNRRGNPGIIKNHSDFPKENPKEFDRIKKGDMVFTNWCKEAVKDARDRGAYVVSVTVNYINNEFRPQGYTLPNENNLMLRDVSNDILHSHVPYHQGLVHAPEIPEIPICPSTTTGSGTLFWMLNAEIANKLANDNAKEVDKSAEYLRIVTERVEQTKNHMDRIREVAVTMARRIREGGRWFAKSMEHPGFADELWTVECGPMIVNYGDWDAARDKNVMIISAISPAFPGEVKLALEKMSYSK